METKQQQLEQRLAELRRQWKERPTMRGIIERQARAIQNAIDALRQKQLQPARAEVPQRRYPPFNHSWA